MVDGSLIALHTSTEKPLAAHGNSHQTHRHTIGGAGGSEEMREGERQGAGQVCTKNTDHHKLVVESARSHRRTYKRETRGKNVVPRAGPAVDASR